jgi:type III restriction enzyme
MQLTIYPLYTKTFVMSLKLQFQSLQYQTDAVQQVVDLFVGQPSALSWSFTVTSDFVWWTFSEQWFGNNLILSPDTILSNLQWLQQQFNALRREQYNLNLDPTQSIPGLLEESMLLDNKQYGTIPNFSVEMETGTGKTYVYLKTIYELYKTYGFNKFIIIVPSVPIREWVWKSIDITKAHFEKEYDLTTMKAMVYDSKKMSLLRDFATTNDLRIMITTIDAINKDTNLFNRSHDKMNGIIPRELVQGTNPFVIIDEPQSVDNTDIAKTAIKSLNPCSILRYSATHKELYHSVYRLTPVDAYDMWLVKKIEINSVVTATNSNQSFVKLEKIIEGKWFHKADISLDIEWKLWVERKRIRVSVSDDLYNLSNYRTNYRDGWYVQSIDATPWYESIEFSNGTVIVMSQSNDSMQSELIKSMIEETIREHFEKERRFKDHGIKVLSLFFLDSVANYRVYTDGGYELGDYAKMFEESYTKIANLPTHINTSSATTIN